MNVGRARDLDRAFFDRAPEVVAADIIGCTLLFEGCGGVVVESEADGQRDPASHSFRGEITKEKTHEST